VEGITYAHKIDKTEGQVDWTESADVIARKVRAFNPFPGLSTQIGAESVKLWMGTAQMTPIPAQARPGEVLFTDPQRGVGIATGDGIFVATELQKPGGKRLLAAEFLRGVAWGAGQR
jgi:methionyl-tRNA formyltransferase